MLSDLWKYNRRLVVIVVSAVVVVVLAVLTLALAGGSGTKGTVATPRGGLTSAPSDSNVAAYPADPTSTLDPSQQAVAKAGYDAALKALEAVVAVTPAVSTAYPALAPGLTQQPEVFAEAFTNELFAVDYHKSTRADLLAWAQYESAPLATNNVDVAQASKVLVFSLTDPAATDVPVTAVVTGGRWLALGVQSARATVSEVHATEDPSWTNQVAGGYSPTDPLETVVDVSATVTLHTTLGNKSTQVVSAVAFTLTLASSPHGGYAATFMQNFVTKAVS